MKAIFLDRKAGAEALVYGELPVPIPGEGEVLVKIHATAVTPTELQWFPTFAKKSGEPRLFPIVLGHEFSGVVEALGPNVNGFEFGDAVYGLNDWFTNGAQAEFCVAPASALALKPKTLSHDDAAVVPISALTAWQGLLDRAKLEKGQTVLIHGASGGVGVFAVQLAHSRGARVIATASAAHLDFVQSLGADQVLDYRATRFENVVRDVDVVFDTVGGDTLTRSWNVLKPGGQLVSVASSAQPPADQRDRDAFMLVQAKGSQLTEIGKWIDNGALRVFVAQKFPLVQARDAFERAQKGGMRGKAVLTVAG